MNIISKISAGKASLFTAFCLICFPLGVVINLADKAGGRGDQLFLLLLIPFLWSLYGVWKCAFNVRYRSLGYVSRGVIVANGLIFLAVFVATFANEIRQPQAIKSTIPKYRTIAPAVMQSLSHVLAL